MTTVKIALANVRFPSTPEESLEVVLQAIKEAAHGPAAIVCFPESILPGYRSGSETSPPNQSWLNRAWSKIDAMAAEHNIAVILGTERHDNSGRHLITARVTNADGSLAGFQDKVQLDPSEEALYTPGTERHLFQCGKLTFGIVICHEGWRYPETVRWAARNGAHVVFHPHIEVIDKLQTSPVQFADPKNSFHEKAALCRAAENTCYFATVNCALQGSCTTSALIDPQGMLITHQPYAKEGILFGEVQLEKATRLLAKRFRLNSLSQQNANG